MASTSCAAATVAAPSGIGVNWGMNGDNLPPEVVVVSLCRSSRIDKVRLFHPEEAALRALRGSGIAVILGPFNQDLPWLASDPPFASRWVNTNVKSHANNGVRFRCICPGNEVIPRGLAEYVVPTKENARIYNNKVVRRVRTNRGIPKRPSSPLETYILAMFNENRNPAGVLRNFGLFYPDATELYHVDF